MFFLQFDRLTRADVVPDRQQPHAVPSFAPIPATGGDACRARSEQSHFWQLSGGWGREGRLSRVSGTRW
ncbi:hypothetical protein J2W78_002625 [Methylorubrum extorquens]|nr:hypothetical protein [Methylorubrum extorquens]